MTRWPLFPGDKFKNLEKVGLIKCPVLVMHGMADATIPVWHGKAIYEALPGKRMHLWVEGAEHGSVAEVAGDEYWKTIRAFADSLQGP
jgi:abhydrolase domain-containing protein 17